MVIEITRLIRRLKKELSDAEWEGSDDLADRLKARLDILLFKYSIGERYEVDF